MSLSNIDHAQQLLDYANGEVRGTAAEASLFAEAQVRATIAHAEALTRQTEAFCEWADEVCTRLDRIAIAIDATSDDTQPVTPGGH